jgi:hypothetical protein
MTFELELPVVSIEEEDLYKMVRSIAQYFIQNPDQPYVVLTTTKDDGTKDVVGRITNPSLDATLNQVQMIIDRHMFKNAVRTVQINTK